MSTWSHEVFAKNLKLYMERHGKKQNEIAEIAGVSTSTVSDWIKAKKYPRIDKIELLANYFGVMKSDLIEDKSEDDMSVINDLIASVVIRMQTDDDFRRAVEVLYKMDGGKVSGVRQMLEAFGK